MSTIRALRVPADDREPCRVVDLRATAVDFSEAIGGGLLDDAFYSTVDKQGYCLYLDDERDVKRLPPNPRAEVLAARLGWIEEADRVRLRGDVLLTGADQRGDDEDVPPAVLTAAWQGGLLGAGDLQGGGVPQRLGGAL